MVKAKSLKKDERNKTIERKKYILNAAGRIFGRLACEVAKILNGKNKTNYLPYLDQGDGVVIENIDKAIISGRKLEQDKYHRYTGYPGGIRTISKGDAFMKDPAKIFTKTVYQMLPKNKLRKSMIKRLEFKF
ncbi:MAG: 50S ribosomal protein L13 [Patescibacteria group bacterium]